MSQSLVPPDDGVARAHVWFHDGRSLCDRRARPIAHDSAEAEAIDADIKSAPACAACVVAVDLLVGEARDLVRTNGVPDVAPATAVWQLSNTRYGHWIDFGKLTPQMPSAYVGSHLNYLLPVGDDES